MRDPGHLGQPARSVAQHGAAAGGGRARPRGGRGRARSRASTAPSLQRGPRHRRPAGRGRAAAGRDRRRRRRADLDPRVQRKRCRASSSRSSTGPRARSARAAALWGKPVAVIGASVTDYGADVGPGPSAQVARPGRRARARRSSSRSPTRPIGSTPDGELTDPETRERLAELVQASSPTHRAVRRRRRNADMPHRPTSCATGHPAGGSMPRRRSGTVRLTVSDLDRSRTFYERALGLRADRARRRRGSRSARPADAPLIELRGDSSAPRLDRRATGLFHLAILVPDPAGPGVRAGAPGRGALAARRRLRPSGQRGAVPLGPGRQRDRDLPRPPARGVAVRRRVSSRWRRCRSTCATSLGELAEPRPSSQTRGPGRDPDRPRPPPGRRAASRPRRFYARRARLRRDGPRLPGRTVRRRPAATTTTSGSTPGTAPARRPPPSRLGRASLVRGRRCRTSAALDAVLARVAGRRRSRPSPTSTAARSCATRSATPWFCATPTEPPARGRRRYPTSRGDVAEWLRSGLQSRLHRFDSGRRLYLTSGLGCGGRRGDGRWRR